MFNPLEYKNFIVKKSKVHNLGLFAARRFIKGETILFRLPNANVMDFDYFTKDLPEADKINFLSTNERVYDIRNSELRYMNHSETPNVDWHDGTYYRLEIEFLQNIRKGSEIFINYGWVEYPWSKNGTSN